MSDVYCGLQQAAQKFAGLTQACVAAQFSQFRGSMITMCAELMMLDDINTVKWTTRCRQRCDASLPQRSLSSSSSAQLCIFSDGSRVFPSVWTSTPRFGIEFRANSCRAFSRGLWNPTQPHCPYSSDATTGCALRWHVYNSNTQRWHIQLEVSIPATQHSLSKLPTWTHCHFSPVNRCPLSLTPHASNPARRMRRPQMRSRLLPL
jgi:hypothetical protein